LPTEKFEAAPFLAWLEEWVRQHPGDSISALCDRADPPIEKSTVTAARANGHVYLKFVDRILVAAGAAPEVLRQLYPLP
jgi:hypothetical protein